MFAMMCTFFRWYMLVRVIDSRFTLRAAYLLGFIGNLFNLVIPGAVGGDLIKATYLAQMEIKRTQAVASMVIDRILGLLGLFILAGLAGFFAWPMAQQKVRILIVLVWIAVVCGLILLTAIFSQRITLAFPSCWKARARAAVMLRELRGMSDTYRHHIRLIVGALIGSSFIHSLFVVAFYLVCLAIFGSDIPGLGATLLDRPADVYSRPPCPSPSGHSGLVTASASSLARWSVIPAGSSGCLGSAF